MFAAEAASLDRLIAVALATPRPARRSPDAWAALENAREAIEEEEREWTSLERRRANELWRALRLAVDLETFEALVRGESVPLDRLDEVEVRRFGRRAA